MPNLLSVHRNKRNSTKKKMEMEETFLYYRNRKNLDILHHYQVFATEGVTITTQFTAVINWFI